MRSIGLDVGRTRAEVAIVDEDGSTRQVGHIGATPDASTSCSQSRAGSGAMGELAIRLAGCLPRRALISAVMRSAFRSGSQLTSSGKRLREELE